MTDLKQIAKDFFEHPDIGKYVEEVRIYIPPDDEYGHGEVVVIVDDNYNSNYDVVVRMDFREDYLFHFGIKRALRLSIVKESSLEKCMEDERTRKYLEVIEKEGTCFLKEDFKS